MAQEGWRRRWNALRFRNRIWFTEEMQCTARCFQRVAQRKGYIILYLRIAELHVVQRAVHRFIKGRFYKLVLMEGSISILLGCLYASRTVSFCFSFGHVARYAPSRKAKTYGTIAANTSQANL